uniref:Major facilitator superfamily (MFS) profile domain-containing protein n=1 Tax=Moniliophthora roreri TaxID=221103 RepID=A0A0W0F6T5_MONRR
MEPSKPTLTSLQSTDTLHSTLNLVESSNGQENFKSDTQNNDQVPEDVPAPIDTTRIEEKPSIAKEEIDVVPDGGLRAWLVIFGITCCTFTTFGLTSSWGFFQAYYQHSLLQNSSPSTIAWIGSIQYALAFLPCMIVGRLFDLGYFHSIFVSASIILVSATMLVAQCTVYWQLLLCQGFLSGIACGVIVGPTTAILAQWFKEKRALALGFTAAGSALGGTLFPITARALLPRIGYVINDQGDP